MALNLEKEVQLQREKVNLQLQYRNIEKEIREAKKEDLDRAKSMQKEYEELVKLEKEYAVRKKETLDVELQLSKSIEKTFNLLDVKMPKTLKDFLTSTKSLNETFKGMLKTTIGILDVLTSWRGAVGLVALAIGTVIDLYKGATEVMREWKRATSSVAIEVGGIGKQWPIIQKQIGDIWKQTAGLGWSMQEAAEHAKALMLSFSDKTVLNSKTLSKTSIEFAQGLGLGSEATSKLMFSLSKAGVDIGKIKSIGFDFMKISQRTNIPVGLLAKDMSNMSKEMAVFGKTGIDKMPAMITYARQLGGSFETMYKSMEVFDKISSGAEVAGKIGAMFGVQINAMEMLVTIDPASRMEKMRQALFGANKEYKNMDYYQVKALSQTLNMSKEEIAIFFDKSKQAKSYAQIQEEIGNARAKDEKEQKTAQKDMNMMIRETGKLFRDFGPATKALFMSIEAAFKPLYEQWFNTKSGIISGLTEFFRKLAGNKEWQQFLRDLAAGMKEIGNAMASFLKNLTPANIKNALYFVGVLMALRTGLGIGAVAMTKGASLFNTNLFGGKMPGASAGIASGVSNIAGAGLSSGAGNYWSKQMGGATGVTAKQAEAATKLSKAGELLGKAGSGLGVVSQNFGSLLLAAGIGYGIGTGAMKAAGWVSKKLGGKESTGERALLAATMPPLYAAIKIMEKVQESQDKEKDEKMRKSFMAKSGGIDFSTWSESEMNARFKKLHPDNISGGRSTVSVEAGAGQISEYQRGRGNVPRELLTAKKQLEKERENDFIWSLAKSGVSSEKMQEMKKTKSGKQEYAQLKSEWEIKSGNTKGFTLEDAFKKAQENTNQIKTDMEGTGKATKDISIEFKKMLTDIRLQNTETAFDKYKENHADEFGSMDDKQIAAKKLEYIKGHGTKEEYERYLELYTKSTKRMAGGGTISFPSIAFPLNGGEPIALAENGPEDVVPRNGGRKGGGGNDRPYYVTFVAKIGTEELFRQMVKFSNGMAIQ